MTEPMKIPELLALAMKKHGEIDDWLGKQASGSAGSALSNDKAAELLIAIATSHIMGAEMLLKLAMGSEGAAQVLYRHADALAAEPYD